MKSFDSVYERAVNRKGGEAALKALLPIGILDNKALAAITNSEMKQGMAVHSV